MNRLVQLGSWCAIAGGALRMISTFVPYVPGSPALEAFYFVIDANFLIALVALYQFNADRLGGAGMAAFLLALIGIASIVGPDSSEFGLDFYAIGTTIFAIGLAALSICLLRIGAMKAASRAWLLAVVLGALSQVTANPHVFNLSGLVIGTGFVLAGWSLAMPSRNVP